MRGILPQARGSAHDHNVEMYCWIFSNAGCLRFDGQDDSGGAASSAE
jgi:hypothetical protein